MTIAAEVTEAVADTKVTTKVMRLHHNAFPIKDQEVTRQFYEEVIGIPLVATWSEAEIMAGPAMGTEIDPNTKPTHFVHTFYELADGSALAFFAFEHPEDTERWGAPPGYEDRPHIHFAMSVPDRATQDEIWDRLVAAGHEGFKIDHGYVLSIYVRDPDGLLIEFCVDPPNISEIHARKRPAAHKELAAWMAGDHTTNNYLRVEKQ